MLKYLRKGIRICCSSQVIKAKPENWNKTDPCVVGHTEQKLISKQQAPPSVPGAQGCATAQQPSLEGGPRQSWDTSWVQECRQCLCSGPLAMKMIQFDFILDNIHLANQLSICCFSPSSFRQIWGLHQGSSTSSESETNMYRLHSHEWPDFKCPGEQTPDWLAILLTFHWMFRYNK